jgi:hypothetical protein
MEMFHMLCRKNPEASGQTWKDKIVQQLIIQSLAFSSGSLTKTEVTMIHPALLEGKKGRDRYLFNNRA